MAHRYPDLQDSANTDAWKRYTYPPPGTQDPYKEDKAEDSRLDQRDSVDQGRPSLFGGVYSRKTSIGKEPFFRGTQETAPAHQECRIVALCAAEKSEILHGKDLWFLSDFLLAFHLFHGLTQNQTWLLPDVDINRVLEAQRDNVILHGNPYYERKVVLNKTMYESMKSSLTPWEEMKLRTKFQQVLEEECRLAKRAGEKVLILMFGHGVETGQFWFRQNKKPEGSEDKERHMEVKDLLKHAKLNLGNKDLPVMLVNTACHGGSWLAKDQLDISGIAAAGEDNLSKAWRYSGSSGRNSGSMFATSLARRLSKGLNVDDATPEVSSTYFELVRSLVEFLSQDDKRHYTHQPAFKAQKDKWGANWQSKTAIPADKMVNRWENLQDYPRDDTLHVGDFLNRDPDVPIELRQEFRNFFAEFEKNPEACHREITDLRHYVPTGSKRKASHIEQDSPLKTLSYEVNSQWRIYCDSCPGDPEQAGEKDLYRLMTFSLRKDPFNFELLNQAKQELNFRLTMLGKAQGYVDFLKIGRPKDLSIYRIELAEFWYEMNKASDRKAKDPHYFDYAAKRFKGLFPDCNTRDFYGKPYDYMRAALACTATPKSHWEPRLKNLIVEVEGELDHIKDELKKVPHIHGKRLKMVTAFKTTIRAISPQRSPPSTPKTPSGRAMSSAAAAKESFGKPHPLMSPMAGLNVQGRSGGSPTSGRGRQGGMSGSPRGSMGSPGSLRSQTHQRNLSSGSQLGQDDTAASGSPRAGRGRGGGSGSGSQK